MRSAAMQSLTNELKARYPGIIIGGIGDDAHKLRASDHNEDDTAGSRAAQSDTDNNPEHRALDVMRGPALSRDQAYALIRKLLATPQDLARLTYINFENTQWARSRGWQPVDNSDDPHPTHIHISGLASADEDARPWLQGDDMEQTDPLIGKTNSPGRRVGDALTDLSNLRDALLGAGAAYPLDTVNWPKPGSPLDSLARLPRLLAEHASAPVDSAALAAVFKPMLDAMESRLRAEIRDAVADLGEGGAAQVRGS